MTWGITAQRRAEEFDALVERVSTGRTTTSPEHRDADLVPLVAALRATPEPPARPEFVADLRARLMAEAETALVPTDVSRLQLPARHTRRERRLAAVVGGIAVVGATTSVALASQSAMPGQSLYPIKRALESAHSGLSIGDASKGTVELANASQRLDEVQALTGGSGLADEHRIEQTLQTFSSQASDGADLLVSDYEDSGNARSIARLRDFASTSMGQLEAIEPHVPYAARDDLLDAANGLVQIDAEAAQRCPTCGGTPLGDVPQALLPAEQVVVPDQPAVQPVVGSSTVGRSGGAPNAPASQGPQLPEVGSDVPPGSVQDPAAPNPSPTSHPLKTLTDGVTGLLTGKGSDSGSRSGSGSSPSAHPVGDAAKGVTGILTGVLDPITGQLLPSSKSTP